IKEAEIARKEQVPCPVQGHLDSARPRRQLEEIYPAPQEPVEETRDLHAKHFRDGLVTANRAELPEGLEAERFGWLAFQDSNEVERRLATLAFRELARWSGRVVFEG